MGVARGHPAPVDTSLAGSLAPGKSVGVARTDNDHRVASAAAAVAVTFCVRLFRPHWLVAAARGVSCRSARRSRDTPSDTEEGASTMLSRRREEGEDAPRGSANLRCTVGEVS